MHLLFDFDGTLADSFDCVIEKSNLLAQKFSFKTITPKEKEELRDLSSIEVMHFLKIPKYKIPTLIFYMQKELRSSLLEIKPQEGLKPILETLYADKQYTLGILTSNSIENVNTWLLHNQMQHLFQFIHVEATYFSKSYLIKKTLSKYKIDKSKTLYICDETRDIDAASKNNIPSAAVTWGYNSQKRLAKSKPTWIICKPRDLLDTIQKKLPTLSRQANYK